MSNMIFSKFEVPKILAEVYPLCTAYAMQKELSGRVYEKKEVFGSFPFELLRNFEYV